MLVHVAVSLLAASARRRRLSYDQIVTYSPGSSVTDHNAIDMDQMSLEYQLGFDTTAAYTIAKDIYTQGGHSKSIASLTLNNALNAAVAEGTSVTGVAVDGTVVAGTTNGDYSVGDEVIEIKYSVGDAQATYVRCQVGGLPATSGTQVANSDYMYTQGCFTASGVANIEGYGNAAYSYSVTSDNINGRTLQGFSTDAYSKMYTCSVGCPYADYAMFYDYYGVQDYANAFTLAGLDGTDSGTDNYAADCTGMEPGATREEIAKKTTAYVGVYMYVIREFEDAIDDCSIDCIHCNDDPVHAWDEGVAFYIGSQVGDGLDGGGDVISGYMPYALANKRCANFKTCGHEGTDLDGIAKANYDFLTYSALGQHELLTGNCEAVVPIKQSIVNVMRIPLIQGTLRYGYYMTYLGGSGKQAAEGVAFASGILPAVAYCDASAAAFIAGNMVLYETRPAGHVYDFVGIKAAFESVYSCLNITCAQVGGFYLEASEEYYADAAPCVDPAPSSDDDSSGIDTGLLVGAIVGGVVGGLGLLGIIYFAMQAKKATSAMDAVIQKYEGKGSA